MIKYVFYSQGFQAVCWQSRRRKFSFTEYLPQPWVNSSLRVLLPFIFLKRQNGATGSNPHASGVTVGVRDTDSSSSSVWSETSSVWMGWECGLTCCSALFPRPCCIMWAAPGSTDPNIDPTRDDLSGRDDMAMLHRHERKCQSLTIIIAISHFSNFLHVRRQMFFAPEWSFWF